MKIGFIGLGNMGAPMARNLVAAGHTVLGFDMAAPLPDGVTDGGSAAMVAQGVEVVITMLPNGDALRAVAASVIPVMAPGSILLDCSTVEVETARMVANLAEGVGLQFADAPVSGGAKGAEAGTLTFMVGGNADTLEAIEPLLDVMGARSVHCGAAGAGQAAKICNNMILGATMAVTCEAFALADKLGLSAEALYDVASTSSGQSWSLTTYCPAPGIGPEAPSDHDYAPGFAAALMLKDLRLAVSAAEVAGARTPVGAEALTQYAQFVEREGGGHLDFSALLPRLRGVDAG